VLLFAVVVRGAVATTNVGELADFSIPGVAKVRELGTATNGHVLGFVEGADLAVGTQVGAGTQVGERAHRGTVGNARVGSVAALDRCALAHHDVGQGGVRSDDCVGADDGFAVQLGARLEGGVLADHD